MTFCQNKTDFMFFTIWIVFGMDWFGFIWFFSHFWSGGAHRRRSLLIETKASRKIGPVFEFKIDTWLQLSEVIKKWIEKVCDFFSWIWHKHAYKFQDGFKDFSAQPQYIFNEMSKCFRQGLAVIQSTLKFVAFHCKVRSTFMVCHLTLAMSAKMHRAKFRQALTYKQTAKALAANLCELA